MKKETLYKSFVLLFLFFSILAFVFNSYGSSFLPFLFGIFSLFFSLKLQSYKIIFIVLSFIMIFAPFVLFFVSVFLAAFNNYYGTLFF